MPVKKIATKKIKERALADAGVIKPGKRSGFLSSPSWTGTSTTSSRNSAGLRFAPASSVNRFKHWICEENGTCLPHEEEEFTENINWRIFRIMAEFVEGFEFLSRLSREVTFFGSARSQPESKYYKMARLLAQKLGQDGFTIITGGGPGIMEAGNRGAYDAGAESVGLDIALPTEQRRNKYVRQSKGFHYFFTRKVMLSASAQAYVFFPGGFGTLDELFEIVALIQTGKMSDQVPVILIGKDYWAGLLSWLKKEALSSHKFIEPFEFKILRPVDSVNEAYRIIKETRERNL